MNIHVQGEACRLRWVHIALVMSMRRLALCLLALGFASGPWAVVRAEVSQADVDYLVGCLSHRDLTIRVDAIEDLGRLGAPAADEVVALLHDDSERVRGTAVAALGAIGGPVVVDPLLGALHDRHHHVVSRAAKALADMGESRAVEPLIELAGSSSHYRRIAACEALGVLGDGRAVLTLLKIARYDPHPHCEPAAVDALRAITGKDFGYDVSAWAGWIRSEHPDWLKAEKKPLGPRTRKLLQASSIVVLGGAVVIGWMWRNL